MRRAWWLILLTVPLAACSKHKRDEPRFRSTGTLIHEGLQDNDTAGWDTELEILKSYALLEEVARELERQGRKVTAEALAPGVSAKRRAGSRVIEVTVGNDDDFLAAATCNLVLELYITRRRSLALQDVMMREKVLVEEVDALAAQLRADGGTPAIAERFERQQRRLDELQLERNEATFRTDVRPLDHCRTTGRKK